MTPAELDDALAAYSAGLDAELSLLRRLHEEAVSQRDATARGETAAADAASRGRDLLMAGLLEIESQLRPLRDHIAAHRRLAATRPAFAGTSSLHRVAERLVRDILGADQDTLAALRAAAAARRDAARLLEAGGNTLAAYRRVIAPLPANASLVDEQG